MEVNRMRTVTRKSSIVKAVDLRERRQRADISTERMADLLEVSDMKHISAIELGKCSITTEKAVRAAYLLGGLTLELPGLGYAVVVPLRERMAVTVTRSDMRPGEAAWVVLEETQEAARHIPAIQKTAAGHDRDALVHLCGQVICDTQHALETLGAAIDAVDPTIRVEADMRHATKLMKRGVRPAAGAPVGAA
jgi:transcriptional regulator with XRE-family HTH domain